MATVRATIEQSRRRYEWKHADAIRLSDRSIERILHRDLRMHPYKIVIAQELSERDCETRTTLCRGTFPPFRPANKQNFRYWSHNNPREFQQLPLHSPKVNVWCAILEFDVWGP
jgi:hypothetical protein